MSEPSLKPTPDTPREIRRTRTRFTFGIVLLLVGSIILASNLGFVIPYDWWSYWPYLLMALGAAQFAWPGNLFERLAGYWLLVVGLWGVINLHELFGLHWGNSWPIFIIAAGLRVILGGMIRRL